MADQVTATDDLICVLQHEVGMAATIADELRHARLENARYLAAIRERDVLIREYIETIQSLRSEAAGGMTS